MLKLTWIETGLEDLEWWHQYNSKKLKYMIMTEEVGVEPTHAVKCLTV